MKKFTILMSLFCLTIMAGSVFADDVKPPVKMSKSEICHATDSSYYNRTKNFTAYETLESNVFCPPLFPFAIGISFTTPDGLAAE